MRTFLIFILAAVPIAAFAQTKLAPKNISLKDGHNFTLNLPSDFEIIPAAEGLKRVRFFAKAPDGRIFVTDLYNLTDNKRGAVYILDGWDAKAGKFAKVVPYMTELRNPNSVQFYRDTRGQEWLYLAETDKLTRRKFTRGEEQPTDTDPQTLATFPDYGLDYKYGGWHLTRTIAFGAHGKLYVSVGSSCNSCEEKERIRASIIEMNPDGSGQREFARGLRNAVSIKWFGNFLFATNQGSDHLGSNRPDETFYAIKDGADYGWPYCHSNNGKLFADPKLKRSGGCSGATRPYAAFPARSSALGFDYFTDPSTRDLLKNAFVVALHGSTDKDIGRGYKIVVMRKGERLQNLVTGFLEGRTVHGRPCDIMKLGANSFLFTDDNRGVVYLVRKKGTTTEIAGEPFHEEPDIAIADIPRPAPETAARSCFGVAAILGLVLLKLGL